MSARALMVMGTASGVGKSIFATALCRAFSRAGVRVAPFKAQNMSNNAAVCPGGAEIGRSQAVQAEACGLQPCPEINPVLLKPESTSGSQVVIRGQAQFSAGMGDYERYRTAAWPAIVACYQDLVSRFELIIIEGAGGAAEINLRDRDLANWRVAELAEAAVLLVADIDQGGVFASLIGTVELLRAEERQRLRGLVINRFRGDLRMFGDGIRFIEERTRVPVLGVLPFVPALAVPQEDSSVLDRAANLWPRPTGALTIGVLHFPRIANHTDFGPLEFEPGVALHYLSDPALAPDRLDVLVLPGSKSTVGDLEWLRRVGWEDYIVRHRQQDGLVVGICGGYQMLGRLIADPFRVESHREQVAGLGLLPVETRFSREKVTARVRATHPESALEVQVYEIHAGRVRRDPEATAPFRIVERDGAPSDQEEGALSPDGRVVGTTLHGLFDNDAFRAYFLAKVRRLRGLPSAAEGGEAETGAQYQRLRSYDELADLAESRIGLRKLADIARIRLP